MASLNRVILIGNLGADPEIRNTENNTVATFSIATSEQWTDRSSGERKERTEWHRIVVWGRQAELCQRYLSKGRTVCVEGRIQSRKYTDRDGQERTAYEINASNLTFLGSGGGNGGGNNGDWGNGGGNNGGWGNQGGNNGGWGNQGGNNGGWSNQGGNNGGWGNQGGNNGGWQQQPQNQNWQNNAAPAPWQPPQNNAWAPAPAQTPSYSAPSWSTPAADPAPAPAASSAPIPSDNNDDEIPF